MSHIGSTRQCAGMLLRSGGLARFQSLLAPKDFAAVAQQTGCAPKKPRPLIPEVVSWLMMLVALHTESMTQGLIQAWDGVRSVCPKLPATRVSEEAFCQARQQLPLAFWRALWNRLRSRYEDHFDHAMRWKGRFRVLAADGSEVVLPRAAALIAFFGCPKGRKGQARQPQGRLVAICSVFTGFCLAFKFLSLRFSEHAALRHLIRKLKINDLLLLDRGFFSLRRDLADPAAQSPFPDTPHPTKGRRRPTHPTPWSRRMDRSLLPRTTPAPPVPWPSRRTDRPTHPLSAAWLSAQLAADLPDEPQAVLPGGIG